MSFGYQVLGFGAFPNRTVIDHDVGFSAIFDKANTEFLNDTPGAGDQQKWTISWWSKFCNVKDRQCFISQDAALISINENAVGSNRITMYIAGSSPVWYWETNADSGRFRDPSAWYNIVVAHDSTNGTADNRLRLYINGVEVTNFQKHSTGNQNSSQDFGNSAEIRIGEHPSGTSIPYDGYMAEFVWIDGTQHGPTSFGKFADNGSWIPVNVAGLTFGTKGFYLPFSATGSDLGDDASGNGFDFTNNNTVTRSTDSPTRNYCVWSAQQFSTNSATPTPPTFNRGNLDIGDNGLADRGAIGTVSVSSGKWYWEYELTSGSGGTPAQLLGMLTDLHVVTSGVGSTRGNRAYYSTGVKYTGGTTSSYGDAWAVGDRMGVAVDLDNDSIYFAKNNTWQNSGDPESGASKTGAAFTDLVGGPWFPFVHSGGNRGSTVVWDDHDFEYTPPTGYLSMSAENIGLATGNIAIQNSALHFDTVLYEGTGAELAIDTLAFQPDFVWIKNRDATDAHMLFQVISGATKHNSTNLRTALVTTAETLKSFDSSGFTLGTDVKVNTDGENYVAWCWKAGGAASTNDTGSIDSSVSVNTTAGFSVGTYVGTGSGGATVGHGLGAKPEFLIVKEITDNHDGHWTIYHGSNGTDPETDYLLFTTGGTEDNNTIWNDTAPSSTVFTIGSDTSTNDSGGTHLFLAWTSIEGFSDFGGYNAHNQVPNDSTVVVQTGFTPELVVIKSLGSERWVVTDATRDPFNRSDKQLFWHANTVENTNSDHSIDIHANGFQVRNNNATIGSAATFIYMAWAKNPFGSDGAIATAR